MSDDGEEYYDDETVEDDVDYDDEEDNNQINLKTYTTEELEILFEAVQEELQLRAEEQEAELAAAEEEAAATADAIASDVDDGEQEDVFDEDEDGDGDAAVVPPPEDDDDDDDGIELEEYKIALKPRCRTLQFVKELRYNEKIGTVEVDVYKKWLDEADEEHVWALFDALGQHPRLKTLTFRSRGSATQSLPISHLTHLFGEATRLREFITEHIKWQGDGDDYELLAVTLADHTGLRKLELHVESIDVFESTITAAGKIPTLQQVEIHTSQQASDMAGLLTALQSLCNCQSLQKLKLCNVTHRFEILSHMAKLLQTNTTLKDLYIQAQELDLNGGMAMAKMITANQGLETCIFHLEKMHPNKLVEAYIQALDMNVTISKFQIILDARTCDVKGVRSMQMKFRALKPKYKVSSQVGLTMGVTVEPVEG